MLVFHRSSFEYSTKTEYKNATALENNEPKTHVPNSAVREGNRTPSLHAEQYYQYSQPDRWEHFWGRKCGPHSQVDSNLAATRHLLTKGPISALTPGLTQHTEHQEKGADQPRTRTLHQQTQNGYADLRPCSEGGNYPEIISPQYKLMLAD